MEGWLDGRMGEWVDEWVDRWVNACTDGRKDRWVGE